MIEQTVNQSMTNIKHMLISPNASLKEAMSAMIASGEKTLFVVDDAGLLKGVLSDGNLRRHILAVGGLTGSISECYNVKPVVLPVGARKDDARELMLSLKIEAIPLVDPRGKVVDILVWDRVFAGKSESYGQIDCSVIIMAGGKGTRLDPFTRILPKPLIPIGETPIVEMIMNGIAKHGVKTFKLSVNHKAHILKAYFSERALDYGVEFLEEPKPLGTAGALGYLRGQLDRPLLVTNCDILIDHPLDNILAHHKDCGATVTLVAAIHHVVIPYGVCEIREGGELAALREKPHLDNLVSTGMYLLDPSALDFVEPDEALDFPDLLARIQQAGKKVVVYPIDQSQWSDVGQWAEYAEASKRIEGKA